MSSHASSPARLGSLDALRGVAALTVALFHDKTNLHDNYPDLKAPFSFPHGHFGVELFFVVSGFVIFMSLTRANSVIDFAVARIARLFPGYWAAVLLTVSVLATGGLPDRTLGWKSNLVNLTMLQEFVGIRHVDGVYWTLSRELGFYLLMAALLGLQQTKRTHILFGLLLLVQAAASLLIQFGVEESRVGRLASLLLYPYIDLFAVGMALFGIHRARTSRKDWCFLGLGLTCELLLPRPDGGTLGHLIVLAAVAAVGLVAFGRLQWLVTRPLARLGSVSYSLYLLHQNIGYSRIHRLTALDIALPIAMALALIRSLLGAHLLRNLVEEPGQQAIKRWWKQRAESRTALN